MNPGSLALDVALLAAGALWLALGGWDAARSAREARARGWLLLAFYGGLAGWVGWMVWSGR